MTKKSIREKYKEIRDQTGYPPTAAQFYSTAGTSRAELKKLFGSDPYSTLQKLCGDVPNTIKRQKDYKLKILLADDNKMDCELFVKTFAQTGVEGEVIVAGDGNELLSILSKPAKHPPDLIFLDLNMPGKNGRQALLEIRKHEKFSAIPIIIFSNSTESDTVDETYEKGANLYLTKPFGLMNQVKLLKKIFKINWKKYQRQPQRSKYMVV